MKCAVKKLVLLFLLLIFAAQAESATSQYVIQFKQHLGISKDLKLTGTRSSSALRFTCESTWKPAAGSVLHLRIEHSPELDSDRSFLSVTLNYGVLRSVRLDPDNQSPTELTIPLPPQMLQPDNEIVFSVEQSSRSQSSEAIWTAIQPSSSIAIEYEANRPMLDLNLLPAPLVDPRSYRPRQLSVLLPEQPSSQTLQSTALLIANYAARAGEALAVRTVDSVEAASENLLIVGTPEEQPLMVTLNLPFQLFRRGTTLVLGDDGKPFETDDGVVALIEKPRAAFTPILLATGNTPEAVSKAAQKLIDGHFEETGTWSRISSEVQMSSMPAVLPRRWKGFLPPANHFTLADMGLKESKFDSQNDYVVTLPLVATPDAEFLAYGHQMRLFFRFSSDAALETAALDVDWNGVSLARFGAADLSMGSKTSIRLKIPAGTLRRQNVLQLKWRGLSETSGAKPSAWLLPESEFDFPRDYRASLPDLSLLQFGLFPFGVRADLSDAILVLPKGEGAAALFEFGGLLGRLVPSERFAFRVTYPDELRNDMRASSHIISFRVGELPKGKKGTVAAVEESVSPWNPGKYLLGITSNSSSALQGAIRTAFSEATLKQLRGDTAYVGSDPPSVFRRTPTRQSYDYSYSTHMQAWLRENWIALPVILTAASCLLFVGLKLILAQYKSKHGN